MWLSKKIAGGRFESADNELGRVTLAGQSGVMTAYEARRLPVCGPGGFLWRPADGQEVLVIKCGAQQVIAAVKTDGADGLLPGEIRLESAGGASITLKNDGAVEIDGTLTVNGNAL